MFGWLKPKTTWVQLKDRRGFAGAAIWTAPVQYDAWGDPFVYRHPDSQVYPIILLPGGECGENVGDAKWVHIKGPDVIFPDALIEEVTAG